MILLFLFSLYFWINALFHYASNFDPNGSLSMTHIYIHIWHICLYALEKCEMSRLWTDARKKWKVGQYFASAESWGGVDEVTKRFFLAQTEIKILKFFNTVLTLCFETSAGCWAAIQMKVQMKEGWGPGREMRPIKTLWCPPSGRLVAGDFPTGFLLGGGRRILRGCKYHAKGIMYPSVVCYHQPSCLDETNFRFRWLTKLHFP